MHVYVCENSVILLKYICIYIIIIVIVIEKVHTTHMIDR